MAGAPVVPPVGQTFSSVQSAPPVISAPVSIAQPPSAAPVVAPPPALDFDDEDDDLPRPGKVWDNSGPSLKELLAQQQAAQAPDASGPSQSTDPGFANVEPVNSNDVGDVWRTLLDMMQAHGPALHSLLAGGNYAGVLDGNAVVRYSKKNETFTKLLDRNGKKDLIREGFSKILGKPVGVRFEVDASAEPDAPVAQAPTPVARPVSRAVAPAPVEAAAPAGPPAIRITEEVVEELKRDALLGAVMDKLAAQPVKIE